MSERACPHCGAPFRKRPRLVLTGDDSEIDASWSVVGFEHLPLPGVITVCTECCKLSMNIDAERLRILTPEEDRLYGKEAVIRVAVENCHQAKRVCDD